MPINRYLLAAAGLTAVAMSSCVDDDYDLSDIDTTAKIQVSDLTLPVNIDPIKLSSMFDLGDDSKVKEVGGIYAVVEDGTFSSSEIKINRVNLRGVAGDQSTRHINLGAPLGPQPGITADVPVTSDPIGFSYSSTDVPAEIRSIKAAGGDFTLSLDIDFPELNGKISKIAFKNLKIKLAKGFDAVSDRGTYDPASGIIDIPEATVAGATLTINLHGTALDFAMMGGTFDPATHSASVSSDIAVTEGEVVLDGADVISTIPADISMVTSFKMSDIVLTWFSGRMAYDITGVNISPVDLNDLPDILSQGDTRVSLVNPQIYLSADNPLHSYGLRARTGLSITSVFKPEQGTPNHTASLDAPGYFEVSSAAESSYVLSPEPPASIQPGFAGATHVPFTALSGILEGNGLPARLDIDLDNPNVFEQDVERLQLGTPLGDVKGKYQFFAPLQLGANSQVVYTDTEDGWNDEDVDAITIEELKVAVTVSSDVPFALKFTGYPIDVKGNQINNVKIEGADIPANADKVPVTIRISGAVTHLDGIRFTATGTVPDDMKQPLSPSQTITVGDLRATVSGYYLKEL